MLNNIWYGGQIRDNKANWCRGSSGKPKLVKKKPLTIAVEFSSRPTGRTASPSPRRTSRDVAVFINPANNVISRTGWEDVKSITGSGKKATIVFKKSYADWEALVSGGLYLALIQGQDMNKMFLTSIPISSGPWRFDSWQKGVQIAVRKNAAYTAGPKLKLDRVVFRYILDTNARFQALKAGEGQVMEPQPQLQIADFMKDKKFVVDQKIGYPTSTWTSSSVRRATRL